MKKLSFKNRFEKTINMVKGWKRNPREGKDNKPIENRNKVEYAWREKNSNPGDYLSVVKDKTNGGYYINYSVGGSNNQTRIGKPYTNKEKARKDAVKIAEMRNKDATIKEMKQAVMM